MKLPLRFLSLLLFSAVSISMSGQTIDPSHAIDEANKLIANDDYAQASDRLLLVLDSLKNSRDSLHPLYSEIWHKLGVIHYMTSNLEDAARYTQTAVRYRPDNSPEEQVALARSLYLHAAIRRELGDLVIARSELKRAMLKMEQVLPSLPDERNTTRLMNMYSEYSRQSWQAGDYTTALTYLDKAFAYYRQDPQTYNYHLADLHFLKSKILKRLGRSAEAITELETAASLWSDSDDPDYRTSRAGTYNNLGIIYLEQQDSNQARQQFQAALDAYRALYSEQPLNFYQQELVNVQANLLRAQPFRTNVEALRTIYAQGIDHARQGWQQGNNAIVADLHQAFAERWGRQQQYDSSYYYFQRALYTSNPFWQDISRIQVAGVPIPDKGKAVEILQAWQEVQQQQYEATQLIPTLEAAYATSLTIDSLLTRIRQSYEAAQSKYDLLDRTHRSYEQATAISLELYERTQQAKYLETAYDLSAKNKAVVLLEGLQNEEAKSFARLPAAMLRQERALKRRYYQLENELHDKRQTEQSELVDRLRDSLFTLSRAYRRLVDRLETEYPAYYQLKYQLSERVLPQEVQAQLPPKTLLLEYFVGDTDMYLFTISRNHIRSYRSALPADFHITVSAVRRLLSEQRTDQQTYQQIGRQLYEWLLAEALSDAEQEGDVERLLIIPDNVLLQIPFEILLTERVAEAAAVRDYPYLLHRYAVSYVYSNQLLFDRRSTRRIRRRQRFAGFGLEYDDYTIKGLEQSGIDLNEGQRSVGPLVYADDEVQEIAALLQGDTWVNQQATKAAFVEHADQYNIIHLSMHGLVDESNPLNSALVFARTADSSDHLLRAGELFALPLQAEMAVLSACHTAYGPLLRGEGIRSLSRAFTYAGCSSLVSSLWSASDKSTKDILTSFYRHLQEGLPKDVALQRAKLDYLKQAPPTLAGPNHWAHLILIGDHQALQSLDDPFRFWIYGAGVALLILFFFLWRRMR